MTIEGNFESTLAGWAGTQNRVPQPRRADRGIAFAFYGRMSTEDYQDAVTSRQWQRDNACELIAGKGWIMTEFFDQGYSRRLRWSRRPQASALLAALSNPDRGFTSVVVGEFERAFCGNQFREVLAVLQEHEMQLWLPELDGPVDPDNPEHMALLARLGLKSKLEVWRCRSRAIAAMAAQTREQGRYLGGRPPYGYRLVDSGAHPNRVHAAWGRRLRKLEPDPQTAPHVRWMFEQRLSGRSVAGIARGLNELEVPCPSFVDPDRNWHRRGDGWCGRTVGSILANPRYTGRQVWNRQYTKHHQDDPANAGRSGKRNVMRWNAPQEWAISRTIVHTPLVDERDFVAAQKVRGFPTPADGSVRVYALGGLLRCEVCGRKFDSHWSNGRPGYRCRHGYNSAKARPANLPKAVYLREDYVLMQLAVQVQAAGRRWAELQAEVRGGRMQLVANSSGVKLIGLS